MRVLPSSFRVLRHRDLRLVIGGNVISQLGTWSQYVGVGWAVRQLTDSKFAVGAAFAATFAASLVLSPVAGVIADRLDRRKLVMVGNLAMAVPPFLAGLLLMRHAIGVWTLIFLVFLGGVAQALTQPASMALVPQLVPAAEIQQAVALNSGLSNATRIVGPGIGGFAISAWGTGWAFHLNAISFFAVVIAWYFIDVPPLVVPAKKESFVQGLSAGFRYATGNPLVGRLLVMSAVLALCVMHAPLMPLIVKDVLHGDASTYALMSSAPGVGALVGALVAGEVTGGRARRRLMSGAALGAGCALLTLSISRSVLLSGGCLVVFGLSQFLLMTLIMTVVVLASDDEYRGRTMGFLSMSNVGIVPINAVTAGLLASVLGPAETVTLASSVLLAFSLWFIAAATRPGGGAAGVRAPPPPPTAGVDAPTSPAPVVIADKP